MNKKSPAVKPESNIKIVRAEEQRQIFSGPLPHPETLARYNEIVPGSAERILSMAEEEMRFRHKNESIITKNVTRTAVMGIIFAFISVIMLSSLVFYALLKGFDTVAGSIAVGSIAAVAGVFVFFRNNKKSLGK